MPQPSVLLKVEVCRRCLNQLAHAAFGETSWFPCEPCRGELDRFLRGWEQRQAHLAQLDRRMEALR